jgi:glutaminase
MNQNLADFDEFINDIKKIYKNTKKLTGGKINSKGGKDAYAISICTVKGQQFKIGNHHSKFVLQSVSKAINYAIALHEVGEEKVHQHVGREPSGRGYNGLVLNNEDLPHNPMINAGAIMVCSLIQPQSPLEDRIQYILNVWKKITGGENLKFREDKMSFDEPSHLRNMAISYYMKEKGAFPKDADIYETIELYKRCNLIEMNVDQLAIAGATLANGGVCPLNKERIFNDDDIRDTLSLMLSCGMYDYSGEFAFLVGLPAKSGVSGALMVIVPGLLAIAIYSPPIEEHGNSVRGVAFCLELVKQYNFHKYDHITESHSEKKGLQL